MPVVSETKNHLDKRYVLFRNSGVYDTDYIARNMLGKL
jgi:hypothetical protein